MEVELDELTIVGVATDQVGQPRSDGSPGSALYRVPIKLSRRPTADEGKLLVMIWDRPPQWTSMHRPGIATVSGDLFVLDGTTVDEVKQYHATTLALVVREVNVRARELRAAAQRKATADEEARRAHRQHVDETVRDIRFE